jgi:hypothetical protein
MVVTVPTSLLSTRPDVPVGDARTYKQWVDAHPIVGIPVGVQIHPVRAHGVRPRGLSPRVSPCCIDVAARLRTVGLVDEFLTALPEGQLRVA